MGGRGSSGGISKAVGLQVTKNGQTMTYYFYRMDGKNYYQRGLEEFPEETPNNMSMSAFKMRVISNGATVKDISSAEKRKAEIAREAGKKETERILNQSYLTDRTFVKGSQMERKRRRAEKRNRRR